MTSENEGGMLTADQILEIDDQNFKKVSVQKWGGHVYIKVMSAADRDEFEQKIIKAQGDGFLKHLRATFLQMCLCNKNGKLLFTKDQIEQLSQKSSEVIDKLWVIARAHNAVSDDDINELKKSSNKTQINVT